MSKYKQDKIIKTKISDNDLSDIFRKELGLFLSEDLEITKVIKDDTGPYDQGWTQHNCTKWGRMAWISCDFLRNKDTILLTIEADDNFTTKGFIVYFSSIIIGLIFPIFMIIWVVMLYRGYRVKKIIKNNDLIGRIERNIQFSNS